MFKEKTYLGGLLRSIFIELHGLPNPSYNEYKVKDIPNVLTEVEYNYYYKFVPIMRILMVSAIVMDRWHNNKIKLSSDEIGKIFGKALIMSYEDMQYDKESIDYHMSTFLQEYEAFDSYALTIDKTELISKGLLHSVCMYSAKKLEEEMPYLKNEISKMGTFASFINNNKNFLDTAINNKFKSVKLIY